MDDIVLVCVCHEVEGDADLLREGEAGMILVIWWIDGVRDDVIGQGIEEFPMRTQPPPSPRLRKGGREVPLFSSKYMYQ